jgi:hypothetical protein
MRSKSKQAEPETSGEGKPGVKKPVISDYVAALLELEKRRSLVKESNENITPTKETLAAVDILSALVELELSRRGEGSSDSESEVEEDTPEESDGNEQEANDDDALAHVPVTTTSSEGTGAASEVRSWNMGAEKAASSEILAALLELEKQRTQIKGIEVTEDAKEALIEDGSEHMDDNTTLNGILDAAVETENGRDATRGEKGATDAGVEIINGGNHEQVDENTAHEEVAPTQVGNETVAKNAAGGVKDKSQVGGKAVNGESFAAPVDMEKNRISWLRNRLRNEKGREDRIKRLRWSQCTVTGAVGELSADDSFDADPSEAYDWLVYIGDLVAFCSSTFPHEDFICVPELAKNRTKGSTLPARKRSSRKSGLPRKQKSNRLPSEAGEMPEGEKINMAYKKSKTSRRRKSKTSTRLRKSSDGEPFESVEVQLMPGQL